MDIKYGHVLAYRNVQFYVSECGYKAYFFCGGCLFAVGRPRIDDEYLPELAKIGLVLRGGQSKPLAAHVRRELLRRGMKWAFSSDEDELFIDSIAVLSRDGICSERELCGLLCLETYDPDIAKYMVPTNAISGLTIQAAYDFPHDRTIHIPEFPIITDIYSDLVYECSRDAFVLTCARLTELPKSLSDLVEGLFDGIPTPREALSSEIFGRRVDVIVTAKKAANTTTVQRAWDILQHGCRGKLNVNSNRTNPVQRKKHARFSSFVQIKYIPPVFKIWSCDTSSCMPSTSLNKLWEIFWKVDSVFNMNMLNLNSNLYTENGSQSDLEIIQSELGMISNALFGRHASMFVGVGPENKNISPSQKFLLLQYIHILNRLPNCYDLIRELCDHHTSTIEGECPTAMPDCALADMTNSLFRAILFLGMATEIVVNWMPSSLEEPTSRVPSPSAFADATTLLDVAETSAPKSIQDLKIRKLALILDGLYKDIDPIDVALRESVGEDTAELLCAAIDISVLSAFEHWGYYSRYMQCIISLIDTRLRNSGCITICS
ncbi:UL21 [Gallid alphaherpesvirus 2]|uniref:Tegument protein UL21 homolog n=3 Tax=Gallid alphaherpesvirus 2 TaxID=10390 RepID=TG21_GAHVM|nr:tegument protein UL21 [Gallid alphaherpesvirus 2]Q9E6P7.1 RecName: Full=Tegument protein UL21 homolog [Marek's disease herpesvirus type 1 strain MD5]ACF49593.1 UL21 [synthetic construct]AEV55000.1 UL21 [Gallid herpesvirus 2 strain 814]AAG14213.1 UL21 tegument protein-like protein [Gallid alphaherpesvirus 2]AAL37974.1 tegument protein [Gallid alphaherpesvirus 2]AAS01660.1 tegument protein [Gallid alphaherpesvirus 2]